MCSNHFCSNEVFVLVAILGLHPFRTLAMVNSISLSRSLGEMSVFAVVLALLSSAVLFGMGMKAEANYCMTLLKYPLLGIALGFCATVVLELLNKVLSHR